MRTDGSEALFSQATIATMNLWDAIKRITHRMEKRERERERIRYL